MTYSDQMTGNDTPAHAAEIALADDVDLSNPPTIFSYVDEAGKECSSPQHRTDRPLIVWAGEWDRLKQIAARSAKCPTCWPQTKPAVEWEKEAREILAQTCKPRGSESCWTGHCPCRDTLATAFARIAAAARADGAGEMRERCAQTAKDHRQELFADGLDCDTADMTPSDAFLAGCQQERGCIEAAIRSLPLPQEPGHD